jgi:ubiquinone/menaquinone biosynthesis C-methylase UbiE
VDIFICSHVLEHVADDRAAMRELYRVLSPAGFGIVMVPLVRGVEETQEDPAKSSEYLRWRYYGSGDHLRQYGKRDFVNRLQEAGFRVDEFGIEWFGPETFRRAGIASESILYVVRKL